MILKKDKHVPISVANNGFSFSRIRSWKWPPDRSATEELDVDDLVMRKEWIV
jgi:hypothetical protein